jgi:hypothetical protein
VDEKRKYQYSVIISVLDLAEHFSQKQNDWHWVKLLRAGKKEPACFASKRDRLAVAFPQFGVKVWLWMRGLWLSQVPESNVKFCYRFMATAAVYSSTKRDMYQVRRGW